MYVTIMVNTTRELRKKSNKNYTLYIDMWGWMKDLGVLYTPDQEVV